MSHMGQSDDDTARFFDEDPAVLSYPDTQQMRHVVCCDSHPYVSHNVWSVSPQADPALS